MSHVEESVIIDADPMAVYAMVTDLTRMGEWSPENVGGRWLGEATGPAVGARFKGSNHKGVRRWRTVCTISQADPGHQFAFSVKYLGMTVSEWSYSFERAGDGCIVNERWTDKRPAGMRRLSDVVLGVRDRREHNLEGIRATLANLRSKAQATKS
jgi:uncharacterized protein YndB with AHSA1/START domain